MCRLFAYISPEEPCLLSDVLINPANAISKQVSEHYLPQLLPHGEETALNDAKDSLLRMRNSLLNMDGMGMAWYTDAAEKYEKHITGPRPALYKTQSPPSNDFNFKNLCSNTETRCVFAHIRATSGSAVTPINNHPFVFGRHLFMHNGVVSDFIEIRRAMLEHMSYDAYANVIGSTDSEHAAALYITHLTKSGPRKSWENKYTLDAMRDAMVATAIQIMQLQHAVLKSRASPNSLNFCATDGQRMVAIRFRNHDSEQPPSLYWSEFAGRTLSSKYPSHPDPLLNVHEPAVLENTERIGKHTIISSEPTTYDESEWRLIGKNHALTVDEHGIETEILIEYDTTLNATD